MSQFFASGGQIIGVSASASPGLISFIMDWSDLLAVQGTLKSLLQHHSSKESLSILAWRIPWTEKPGGLQFMESQRVGHD